MKKMTSIMAAVMVMGAAGAAMASDFYVGANVTHTVAGNVDGATDRVDNGYGLVAGWNVTPSVALEAGYERLGDIKFGDEKVKAEAYSLAAAYKPESLKAYGFEPYGKLGVEHATLKAPANRDTGVSAFAAVGVDYRLDSVAKGLAANFEYKYHDNFAQEDVRVNGVSAGLKYNF